MEERYPGMKLEQNGNEYTDLVGRWLDGLCDITAQKFKNWMFEKIDSIDKIKLLALDMISLVSLGTSKRIWIKKISRATKKWIAQFPWLSRVSVMATYDQGYS
jgi:hypothetical protein